MEDTLRNQNRLAGNEDLMVQISFQITYFEFINDEKLHLFEIIFISHLSQITIEEEDEFPLIELALSCKQLSTFLFRNVSDLFIRPINYFSACD